METFSRPIISLKGRSRSFAFDVDTPLDPAFFVRNRRDRKRPRNPPPIPGGLDPMSHVVTIQTKVHDPAAVAAACQRLNLAAPVQGTARLYSGEATGLIIRLPGWL
jgi:hypothetical protein